MSEETTNTHGVTREDIEFEAKGDVLRGWLYTPDDADEAVPTVVMAHGFSGVKEMHLDEFAEVFSEAGLGVLVFDNRNFGESEGEPRYEIDPWQQVRDYRHAITYLSTRYEVDADSIGIWGTSYSGGHVLAVGAFDTRVSAIVSQVPITDGYHNALRLTSSQQMDQYQELFNEDRLARFQGQEPAMIPVVSEDPQGEAALSTREAYERNMEMAEDAPNWENKVTIKSIEMVSEYSPIDYIDRISPTPLLMIIAKEDRLTISEKAFEAYEEAFEPKELVTLDDGHFAPYYEGFEEASGSACDWFVEHLLEG